MDRREHSVDSGLRQDNFVITEINQNEIIFGLSSPQYDLVQFGRVNIFSGSVLSLGKKTVRSVAVSSAGREIGTFPVDKPRNDIALLLPHMPAAGRCGFDFELYMEETAEDYIFEIIFDDGTREPFFTYEVSSVRQMSSKFRDMNKIIDRLSMPDGALVYLTQGHDDVDAYRNSIIPFMMNVRRYLQHCRVNLDGIATVLDFGCGTGRALVGWYSDNPQRGLFGCDLSGEMISWAKNHLPGSIRFDENSLSPPLPYPDVTFDMVQAISVFTHLSLDTQKLWVREFKRILKPGGYLLITLHGEAYARLAGIELEVFERCGHIAKSSAVEGSNDFTSFHTPAFTQTLFGDFQILGHFPMGKIDNKRILFQIASQQDVYLLRYPGPALEVDPS